ncbi:hypothetical protein [Leptospira stimsonii]|uniref:Uncharacterized protein n=1 Tax=Leptospira stimsonii TaxID=2202203 RepID=A0ABY2N5A8_9LEPT|nr:hypothetical protein [Leptospira stimsonii]TGK10380.1 hypothetical protein EHO98_22990 [Leptospira stimsonii]TGM17276.1 hypothetical protein EHQ90_07805 [Leptospira stimsonii]
MSGRVSRFHILNLWDEYIEEREMMTEDWIIERIASRADEDVDRVRKIIQEDRLHEASHEAI